jgi:hypothetical protein
MDVDNNIARGIIEKIGVGEIVRRDEHQGRKADLIRSVSEALEEANNAPA